MTDHTRRDGTPIDYPARYVRPIDPLMIYRIMDRKPAPRRVANDVEPVLETWGGYFGLAVCIVAVVFMGVCLAVQL